MSMRVDQTNRVPTETLDDLMSSDLMAGGGTEMVVAQAAAQLDDVRQRSRAASRESRTAQRQAERSKLAHERKAAALKLAGALVSAAAETTTAVASLASSSESAESSSGGASWTSLAKPAAQLSNAVLGHFEAKQQRRAEASGMAADASRQSAQQEAESAQSADQAVTRALNHADQIAELMHRARMAEISG